MHLIRDILIKSEKAYKDSIQLSNGKAIFLSQNIKQVKDTIRYGEVLAVPEDCPVDVQVGDTLFFHHNIVGVTVMDENHPDIESSFLIDKSKGLYRVPVNQDWPLLYAVIRNGKFRPLRGICFVRPVKTKKYETSLFIPNNEKEVKHVGEMVYCAEDLKDQGVFEGSKVFFSKDSEYQFEVDGEILYCMFSKWILGLYE